MKQRKTKFFLLLLTFLFFFSPAAGTPTPVQAALKTSALKSTPWTAVAKSSLIDKKGWLQALCATDQYIVCLVNGAKNTTEPDTLIAFYRNDTDADGNPVKPYSYAFHVTETDYEHGNGMTYNPNTREIAIAGLFTNDPKNAGAIFLVDGDTLKFKRKVTVGNGNWNYFGIDYVPEKDQYVLMANRVADYSFVFTDSKFQILDTMNLRLSSSRSSFQDFTVAGDSIISVPYMHREGYMNILDVYSISQKQRIGSYYLTLPGHDAFSVEPEGICQLEPGHLLMCSAIIGTTNFKLYEAYLPLSYTISTSAENGTISKSLSEAGEGESCTIAYSPDENYRLKSLIVDGEEQDIQAFPTKYTFTDVQANHTIHASFEEIPRYTVTTSTKHGTIDTNPSALEHQDLTVSFSPDAHYELDSLFVDGTPVKPDDNTSYTFTDLTTDHTIQAVFREIPSYLIRVEAVNGTVLEENATVYRDESYTTKIEPKKAYILTKYLLDGKLLPPDSKNGNITLENIQGNHTISLVYEWVWSKVAVCAILLFSALLAGYLFLRLQRARRHQQRMREIRRSRRASREYLNDLEELDAQLQKMVDSISDSKKD